MEKFSSIIISNCSKISNDNVLTKSIEEKYGLKVVDYPWEQSTIIEPINRDDDSNTSAMVIVDSNLTFVETLKWCKGIFEGKDIYKDDPSKFIMLNGWEYNDLPGRSYLEMKDKLPEFATVNAIDKIDDELMNPIISGVSVPFLGIRYKDLELTGCKNVNILADGQELLSFKIGKSISVLYTSLTKYQLLNWVKHIVFEGVNVYPDAEIVIENYNEEFDNILKDCIPLYKFKENLLSK